MRKRQAIEKDTLILSARGWVKIEDLRRGDQVVVLHKGTRKEYIPGISLIKQ